MQGTNINYLLKPESIAVIGASRDEKSVGHGVLKSLVRGCVFQTAYCIPFPGKVFPINPFADELLGLKCFKSIKDVREKIDMAVICVPANAVLNVVRECTAKKIKAAVIISSGFGETGKPGRQLQDKIMQAARKGKMRIVGPNCLGVIRTHSNLNASFAPTMPPKGNISFISQSGALADSIIDWSIDLRYGFSSIISCGNQADLTITDFLEWLGDDSDTKVITLYIESLVDAGRFMETAKKISKLKPIIAIKAGRTQKAMDAIRSHTGNLAGSYEIYEAALKQCGIIIADTVEEMFDMAKALDHQPLCRENAVAIVTNGGGCGVLCADYCARLGVDVVELKKSTLSRLDRTGKMHPSYSRNNPLDIVGDALPERYEAAIDVLLSEEYIHGLIVIQTLQTMTDPEQNAKIVVAAKQKYPDKPVLCVYMGGKFSQRGINMLEDADIPDYNDPKKVAMAMKVLIDRGKMMKGNNNQMSE